MWETSDGHQTGRWQWVREHFNGLREVFPGYFMFGDAICVPPGTVTVPKARKRGDDAQHILGMIDPFFDKDDNGNTH